MPLLSYAAEEKRGMDDEPNGFDQDIENNPSLTPPMRGLFMEDLNFKIEIVGSDPVVTFSPGSPYLGKIFVNKKRNYIL